MFECLGYHGYRIIYDACFLVIAQHGVWPGGKVTKVTRTLWGKGSIMNSVLLAF